MAADLIIIYMRYGHTHHLGEFNQAYYICDVSIIAA